MSYVSAILATATDRYATECLKSGNAEILAEYKARCDTLEKQISYTDASGNASCGRAIDVAADGSLIVDDGGKTDKIGWGEITEIK